MSFSEAILVYDQQSMQILHHLGHPFPSDRISLVARLPFPEREPESLFETIRGKSVRG